MEGQLGEGYDSLQNTNSAIDAKQLTTETERSIKQMDAELGKREAFYKAESGDINVCIESMSDVDIDAQLDDLDLDCIEDSDFDSLDHRVFVQTTNQQPKVNFYLNHRFIDSIQAKKTSDVRPKEMYEDPNAEIVEEMTKDLLQLSSFVNDKSAERVTNARGYHIMMPAYLIREIARDSTRLAGITETACYEFGNDRYTGEFGNWRYARGVAKFINYLFSYAFQTDYNDIISERVEKAKSSVKTYSAAAVLEKRKIKVKPFDHKDFFTVWSFEGLDKYLESGTDSATRNVSFLHFHIAIIKRDGGLINDSRFNSVKNMFIDRWGTSVTVCKIFSKNQLFYLGKEKILAGVTSVLPPTLRYQVDELDNEEVQYNFFRNIGYDTFEDVWGSLNSTWNEGYQYRGTICNQCARSTDHERHKFCSSWGWNQKLLNFLVSTKHPQFTALFPGPSNKLNEPATFTQFVNTNDADYRNACTRLKSMIQFQSDMLQSYLETMGVDRQEACAIMSELLSIFLAWSSEAPQAKVYSAMSKMVRENVQSGSGFRVTLAVGGGGGNGKSTIVRDFLAGAGFEAQKLTFTPNSTGRDEIKTLSFGRFYDDVHRGLGSRVMHKTQNLFFNFVSLESARTQLYSLSSDAKPLEFIVATGVDIKGLPTWNEYVLFAGTANADREGYEGLLEQIRRRFVILRLESQEEFLLPYYRFFWGNSTRSTDSGALIVDGIPSWYR